MSLEVVAQWLLHRRVLARVGVFGFCDVLGGVRVILAWCNGRYDLRIGGQRLIAGKLPPCSWGEKVTVASLLAVPERSLASREIQNANFD